MCPPCTQCDGISLTYGDGILYQDPVDCTCDCEARSSDNDDTFGGGPMPGDDG